MRKEFQASEHYKPTCNMKYDQHEIVIDTTSFSLCLFLFHWGMNWVSDVRPTKEFSGIRPFPAWDRHLHHREGRTREIHLMRKGNLFGNLLDRDDTARNGDRSRRLSLFYPAIIVNAASRTICLVWQNSSPKHCWNPLVRQFDSVLVKVLTEIRPAKGSLRIIVATRLIM